MTHPRILLTGANGFVGRQVLANLRDEFEVHCVSRQATDHMIAQFHTADLTDSAACRQLIANIRPTHLIHCAWEADHGIFGESPENLKWLAAGKELFSAFSDYGGQRIVGVGSCAEYASLSDAPICESDDKQTPATLYGRSKLELLTFLRQLPVSHSWVRIFLTYGPHEDQRRFVPSVATALLNDQDAPCSSGKQVRDFLDVRDIGRAIAMLVDSSVEGAINIGHGGRTTLGAVAQRLGELAGQGDRVKLGAFPDRAGEPQYLLPDLTRQHNELEFYPEIPLDQGLSDALEWWRGQLQLTELNEQE